jgi:arylsulfatase A-like enzyme
MIEIMDTPTLKPRKLGLAVVAATIGILVFSGSAAQAKAQPTERPNIILFLVDDLGWQDTSLQLTPAPTAQNMQWRTPNLDALAKRGMRFSNAYAAAPVCTPTRTSLLTGRTPGATHITYWTKSKGQDTSAWHPT